MSGFAQTPKPPYYAVIFSSLRTPGDQGYGRMSDGIEAIVSQQKGFLGVESARNEQGFGITVSYWDSLDSIQLWKNNASHMKAKEMGKKLWYEHYRIRICKVESDGLFH